MNQKELATELESIWEQLVLSYTWDKQLIHKFWEELYTYYTQPERYYHNLNHVYTVIRFIEVNKSHILNYHALLFSAFYHDLFYDVSRDDNEYLSARLAEQRMRDLKVDESIVALTIRVILQTASHAKTNNFDIDLFLDFDRNILSADEEEYDQYKGQIRKEYGIFPENIYRTFRSKFLQQYLAVPEIFFTAIHKGKESKARQNLERELKDLLL